MSSCWVPYLEFSLLDILVAVLETHAAGCCAGVARLLCWRHACCAVTAVLGEFRRLQIRKHSTRISSAATLCRCSMSASRRPRAAPADPPAAASSAAASQAAAAAAASGPPADAATLMRLGCTVGGRYSPLLLQHVIAHALPCCCSNAHVKRLGCAEECELCRASLCSRAVVRAKEHGTSDCACRLGHT
jgi:hypothetical protein